MRAMTMMVAAAAAAGLVAVGGGCGKKSSEKTAEKIAEMALQAQSGGKAKVNIDGDKVSIQSKEGSMDFSAGEGATIPEDFPKDVYVDRGAKLLMAMRSPDGMVLTLETADDVEAVAGKYREEMKAQGWDEEGDINMGGQRVLMLKKEARRASVNVSRADDKTHIVLSLVKDGG